MKLRRIEIENFRGIKSLALDVADTTVLIGENNCGKTAILEALRLCLREVNTRGRVVFEALDFHLKDAASDPLSADPISITVRFSEDHPGEWSTQQVRKLSSILYVKNGLNGISFRVTCSYDVKAREFHQKWEFLDASDSPRPRADAQLNTLHTELAYFYLTALRDAARHFDARGQFWRPFLKDSQLDPAKKADIETKLKEANELVVQSHTSFAQAATSLNRVQDVVPIASGNIVSVEAVPMRLFDLLAKAQVHLSTLGGASVPVGRHGEGTQSLAVLLLFSAFLTTWPSGDPVVALEEPEAHLHPSAVRALWSIVSTIPGQKLISTHSGDLLSEVPIESVRRLSTRPSGVVVSQLQHGTLDADEKRKFDYHVRHARGELLFARCWILVEGETEVSLVAEVARIMKVNLERIGVRCVSHRAAGIELFLKVAQDLRIKWCVLADNDQQGKADQKHAQTYAKGLPLSDVLHVTQEDDIEGYLCGVGFGPVYQNIYNASPQLHIALPAPPQCPTCGHAPKAKPSISASPGAPAYWRELLRTIKTVLVKPEAIQQVLEMVRQGQVPIPPLIATIIQSAGNLAEAPS